jgi:hypothetical protein
MEQGKNFKNQKTLKNLGFGDWGLGIGDWANPQIPSNMFI